MFRHLGLLNKVINNEEVSVYMFESQEDIIVKCSKKYIDALKLSLELDSESEIILPINMVDRSIIEGYIY